MIRTFSGLGTYMKKQTESIKSKNPRHLRCISTSIHLNEWSLKQKKPSPSFSNSKKPRLGEGDILNVIIATIF